MSLVIKVALAVSLCTEAIAWVYESAGCLVAERGSESVATCCEVLTRFPGSAK